MLKIEDVKAGDELVCIDFKGLADHRCDYMPQWLDDLMLSPIIVSNVNIDSNAVYFRNDSRYLEISDLKYFKKKEQSQQYTSDDLIDIAVQAVRDKVIKGALKIQTHSIAFSINSENYYYNQHYIKDGIEHIKSLYKETFVIESEEDIKRIKLCAKITLANGNSGIAMVVDKQYKIIQFSEDQKHWGAIGIFILKGATVEQERGG